MCFHSNTAIEITPLERLVPPWFQPRIFRILFVKPRNRPTDSQRLRRNVLREIHEHSALDRMLFLPGQRFGKPSPLRAAARIETRTSTKSAFFVQVDYFRLARHPAAIALSRKSRYFYLRHARRLPFARLAPV